MHVCMYVDTYISLYILYIHTVYCIDIHEHIHVHVQIHHSVHMNANVRSICMHICYAE